MSIRNVLKVYGLLRDLTDDETALLETLRAFTDTEREQFVEALQPAKVAAKRKPRGKSKRASGMAAAIGDSLRRGSSLEGGVSKLRCTETVDDNGGEMACLKYADDNIHHLATAAGYHEFVGEQQAAGASGD